MPKRFVRKSLVLLSLLALPVTLLGVTGGAVATASTAVAHTSAVTTSSLGQFKPTFAGTAATGCTGPPTCSLLSGPVNTPSTATAAPASAATSQGSGTQARAHAMPPPDVRQLNLSAAQRSALKASTPSFPVQAVSCAPLGRGCDNISTANGGATSVKGLNAVDSAEHTTNIFDNVEPPDQGLCAGNGSVVEANNIGQILIFNAALGRLSAPISFDRIMGITAKGWSSGGDPSCLYDSANGGHWFFTQFVSASPESAGGPFAGCFVGVPNTCLEGIAVTDGNISALRVFDILPTPAAGGLPPARAGLAAAQTGASLGRVPRRSFPDCTG